MHETILQHHTSSQLGSRHGLDVERGGLTANKL